MDENINSAASPSISSIPTPPGHTDQPRPLVYPTAMQDDCRSTVSSALHRNSHVRLFQSSLAGGSVYDDCVFGTNACRRAFSAHSKLPDIGLTFDAERCHGALKCAGCRQGSLQRFIFRQVGAL